MPLTTAQIKVGVVAYLDVEVLNKDPKVKLPPSPPTRNGPFVCIETAGQMSTWTEITTQPKDGRTEIKAEWKKGGDGRWLAEPQFVNDGRTTYLGPKASFVLAATNTDKYQAQTRPRVSPDGVAQVLKAVEERGGALLQPPEA